MESSTENITCVDNNGFLVEGEEISTSDDQPIDTSRYDLSTLETGDTLFVHFPETSIEDQTVEEEMDENAIAKKKKMEEESLLEGKDDGHDDSLLNQQARITMYNQYLPDSESEEEDEDYTAEEDREEVKTTDSDSSEGDDDPENDNYEYACLHESHESDTEDSSGQEDDKGNNGHMYELAENTSVKVAEEEQFGMQFHEADLTETRDSNNNNNTASSQVSEVKQRNRDEAYSNSVPLLKPIPAEKMEKFLKSKGLVAKNDSTSEKDGFIADFAQFGSFSQKES